MSDILKNRLTSVFNFMKALNEIRNPVVLDIEDQLWSMHFGDMPVTEELNSLFQQDSGTDLDYILRVGRPSLDKCPEPDEKIKRWLEAGWDRLSNDVELIDSLWEGQDENKKEVKFSDDKARVKEFEAWIHLRNLWKSREIPKKKCLDIYTSLFKLYSQIQKESESVELILGNGYLDWILEDGRSIIHPIFLQKILLEFNSNVPEFIIKLADGNSELYTALFRTLKDINTQMLSICIDECTEENYQVSNLEETKEFFKRLVTTLSVHGEFINDSTQPRKNRTNPAVYHKPVIFLRKRNQGYSTMIDSILQDIPNVHDLPGFLGNVVGISNETNSIQETEFNNVNLSGQDKDILLSKPANREQLLIAKQLSAYGAVLVQGPPGTGKTHSIANLIGHLLSEGKSILVTSHTEKALKVLKEKVITSLQPLCLSVLSEKSNQSEMDRALNAMNEKRTQIQPNEIIKEIDIIEKRRKQLLDRLKEKRNDLKLARMDQYRDIVVNGESISPIDAAKFIRKFECKYDYIPSPVQVGEPMPLTLEEVYEIYHLNSEIDKSEENEMNEAMPSMDELICPESFKAIIERLNQLEETDFDFYRYLWIEKENFDTKNLIALRKELVEAHDHIKNLDSVGIELIDAGIDASSRYEQWNIFVDMINENKDLKDKITGVLYDFSPIIDSNIISEQVVNDLNEIIQYISTGGKLNVFKLFTKKNWKKIIENSQVNDKSPTKREEFEAIRDKAVFELKKDKLENRWKRQVTAIGGPDISQCGDIIDYSYKYSKIIKKNINWYKDIWSSLENKIELSGFKWNIYREESLKNKITQNEVETLNFLFNLGLIQVVETEVARREYRDLSKQIQEYSNNLCNYYYKQGTLLFELISAISNKDINKYKDTYNAYSTLYNKDKLLVRRTELLKKMNAVAPGWAKAIMHRMGIHGLEQPPQNISEAWKWRQLYDELEIRNSKDLNKIQFKITQLEDELRRVTSDLVEKKAWYEKIKKITFQQTQAIEGWRLTMKSIGRGTGKRVPKLLAEARKLMPKCQSAVPVWIMPLNKVVENFDPKQNRFDVVIIDEASQADIMALNAIYLAKQVVIVGDDEQVSPSAVGQKIDEVEALISSYLNEIPNKQLFTGEFSVYDLARTSGFKPITLTEHFRCLSPIIQFSNYLSYEGNIKALRDESDVQITPPVVSYRVDNATTENKVNVLETEVITSLILACTEMKEYKNKSFGVITMLGDRQAGIIDEMLQRYMHPTEYVNRKIQCGNPANFQGDERDVIFISLVDSPTGDGPLSLRGLGKGEMYKKRYNVAASRSRDQMWVVHSLNPDVDLKDGDIRLRLIKHAENPYCYEELQVETLKKGESEFEKEVIKRLQNRNYNVIPQWKVGAYRIDIVVEGNGKKLAIECDGEKWHGPEKLQDDMNRQAILERLGWRFERIRGSEFFKDPDKSMQKVYERLERLEIPPTLNVESTVTYSSELIEKVKIRAAEIRRDWKNNKLDDLEEGVRVSDIILDKKQKNKVNLEQTTKNESTKRRSSNQANKNSNKDVLDFRNKTKKIKEYSETTEVKMQGVLDFRKSKKQ